MEFRDLIKLYEEFRIRRQYSGKHFLTEYYIEDENQSVKWNREFVQTHNENLRKERDANKEKEIEAYNDYKNAILELIQNELKCSKESSKKICEYIDRRDYNNEEHRLNEIEEIVWLIKEVKEI